MRPRARGSPAEALPGRREPDRCQLQPVDGFREFVEGRYPRLAETQAHHALRALDAVTLRALQVQAGHRRTVADEFAAHRGGLATVDDLGGRAVAEVVLPNSPGQRIQITVDQMGTDRNCE